MKRYYIGHEIDVEDVKTAKRVREFVKRKSNKDAKRRLEDFCRERYPTDTRGKILPKYGKQAV
ncbi:MAG: hypothetical protein QXG05_04220 [Nitrososphaerota archaeon]